MAEAVAAILILMAEAEAVDSRIVPPTKFGRLPPEAASLTINACATVSPAAATILS